MGLCVLFVVVAGSNQAKKWREKQGTKKTREITK